MARIPIPSPKIQFFDKNGDPLAYGKLYTYVAGGSTPVSTYQSYTGSANTNPVILDASGMANVWIDDTTAYKFVLKDSDDNIQWTVDSVRNAGDLLRTDLATATAGNGSDLVAFQNIYPDTDDTYYIGKNDYNTPLAWKALILVDQVSGKYYRIEVLSGVLTATKLTVSASLSPSASPSPSPSASPSA